jgi:hypothetical protein
MGRSNARKKELEALAILKRIERELMDVMPMFRRARDADQLRGTSQPRAQCSETPPTTSMGAVLSDDEAATLSGTTSGARYGRAGVMGSRALPEVPTWTVQGAGRIG